MSKLVYAGYGCYNSCIEVTDIVRAQVQDGHNHNFQANGTQFGDPAPGLRKFLFIVWRADDGQLHSGVIGERDEQNKAVVVGDINDFTPVNIN